MQEGLEGFDRFSALTIAQNPSYYSIVESCHGIAVIFRTKINRYSIFDAERMVLERRIILLFVSIGRGWRDGGKKRNRLNIELHWGTKKSNYALLSLQPFDLFLPRQDLTRNLLSIEEVRWEEN